MRVFPLACLAALAFLTGAMPGAQAKTLRFSGHDFVVRPAGVGGPGPNNWSARNAWVDEQGRLHLKLARRGGKWYAAEVYTRQRFGFGRYEFRIETNVDRLDRNVVLGLFHYPTSDVGPDATHEIDIEFARWGRRSGPVGNYTVWPADAALDYTTRRFRMPANAVRTTHVYHWSADKVVFTSWRGHGTDPGRTIARWRFVPRDAPARIAQQPMPLHINLWAYRGNPPSDGRDVEVIITSFSFTPELTGAADARKRVGLDHSSTPAAWLTRWNRLESPSGFPYIRAEHKARTRNQPSGIFSGKGYTLIEYKEARHDQDGGRIAGYAGPPARRGGAAARQTADAPARLYR